MTKIIITKFELAEIGVPIFIGGNIPVACISKVTNYKHGKYIEFKDNYKLTKFCGWFKNNGELIKGKSKLI